MIRSFIALFIFSASALAQAQTTSFQVPQGSVAWTVPREVCISGGKSWPARNGVCLTSDADLTVLLTTGTTTSNYTPKCDEGWSIVMTGTGYKCAGELRDPK